LNFNQEKILIQGYPYTGAPAKILLRNLMWRQYEKVNSF